MLVSVYWDCHGSHMRDQGLQRPHQSDKAAPRLLGLESKAGIEVMGNDIRTKKEQDTHRAGRGQIFEVPRYVWDQSWKASSEIVMSLQSTAIVDMQKCPNSYEALLTILYP